MTICIGEQFLAGANLKIHFIKETLTMSFNLNEEYLRFAVNFKDVGTGPDDETEEEIEEEEEEEE